MPRNYDITCFSKACSRRIPFSYIVQGSGTCSECGPGVVFCENCCDSHDHDVVRLSKRKRLDMDKATSFVEERKNFLKKRALVRSQRETVHRSISEMFNLRSSADAIQLIGHLNNCRYHSELLPRLQNQFCKDCLTLVEIIGKRAQTRLRCYICSKGSADVCLIESDEILRLEEILLDSGHPPFDGTISPMESPYPMVRAGYSLEDNSNLSIEFIAKEFLLLQDESFKALFPNLLKRKRSVIQHLELFFSSDSTLYLNFPFMTAHGSELLKLVKMVRNQEYGFSGGDELEGITTIEESTLVLLGNKEAGTTWHVDRSRSRNIAFGCHNASGILATWILVSPDSVYQVDGWLKSHRFVGGLKCPRLLSLAEAEALQDAIGVGNDYRHKVVVIHQRHGEMVDVPPGWVHQVRNQNTCLKLAWDVLIFSELPWYVRFWREIITKKLLLQVEDYTGVFPILKRYFSQ